MIPLDLFRQLEHRDKAIITGTMIGLFDAHHNEEQIFSGMWCLLDEEDHERIVSDMSKALRSKVRLVE